MFKNRGFTDQLYFLNFKMVWFFTWICLLVTVFSGKLGITDMSIASVGIPAAFTELGIHTGFIVWKAKCENMSKYEMEESNEFLNE